MDEPDLLPRLLDCLACQSYRQFKLFVCVNQPESWQNDPCKKEACENNAASLRMLHEFHSPDVTVIDHASKGRGWTGKRHGVGWARKTIMDHINKTADRGDIILSLDADTVVPVDYFLSIARNFREHPDAVALASPYFHRTTSDLDASRAILRYEIYMRYYLLNLLRIGSPYAFTALGSAMVLPVWAYRAIGGMTPKLSGEDFYFLQKLRKYGSILLWNDEMVYPEARFSDRVFFGTGPAMIKGATGDWESYPLYPVDLFDEILETYRLLPVLYRETISTPVTVFLTSAFGEKEPMLPLRLNHKDPDHFARAFHEKFDGLRILQFLKSSNERYHATDEENLRDYITRFIPAEESAALGIRWETFSFSTSPQPELEAVRQILFKKEMEERAISTLQSPGRQPL